MQYALLGDTGRRVSRLCFGVGQIEHLSLKAGAELLEKAYRKGVNFWDTADCYGTQPHVRAALKRVPRGKVVVQTKACAYSKNEARKIAERNVKELGAVPDILLLHNVLSIREWEERKPAYRELLRCRDDGLCSHVGFSTHCSSAVLKHVAEDEDVEVILASVHPERLKYGNVPEMLENMRLCAKKGKGLVAMKLLCGGKDVVGFESRLSRLKKRPYIHSFDIGIKASDDLNRDSALF